MKKILTILFVLVSICSFSASLKFAEGGKLKFAEGNEEHIGYYDANSIIVLHYDNNFINDSIAGDGNDEDIVFQEVDGILTYSDRIKMFGSHSSRTPRDKLSLTSPYLKAYNSKSLYVNNAGFDNVFSCFLAPSYIPSPTGSETVTFEPLRWYWSHLGWGMKLTTNSIGTKIKTFNYLESADSYYIEYDITDIFKPNVFHHYAFVISGISDKMALYIDGVKIEEKTVVAPSTLLTNKWFQMNIETSISSGVDSYYMQVDDSIMLYRPTIALPDAFDVPTRPTNTPYGGRLFITD